MITPLKFITLALKQNLGCQKLGRIPEPFPITADIEAVENYNQVLRAKLSLLYLLNIELIRRIRPQQDGGKAIELCSGPGFLSIFLAQYLNFKEVIGIDLSPLMVETAKINAKNEQLDTQVQFQKGDVTQLSMIPSQSVDLTLIAEGAHHLDNLEKVSHVLAEMDRITKPDGLIVVADGSRLRTKEVTNDYVYSTAGNYLTSGLSAHFYEFLNSMLAAWTSRELRSIVPKNSRRSWFHLVPRFLPVYQIIAGLPENQTTLFLSSVQPNLKNPLLQDLTAIWEKENGKTWAEEALAEWKILKLILLQFPKIFRIKT